MQGGIKAVIWSDVFQAGCMIFGMLAILIQVRNAVITIAIRLRFDYDPTTTYRARLLPFDAIRREQKINISVFRRSRIVVESQL